MEECDMWVLGVAGAFCHDPAACLMLDGEVVAMVEEERLSRQSHALGDMPTRAIEWCLRLGGISLGDVDVLALSWDEDRLDPAKLTPPGKFFNNRYRNVRQLLPTSVFGSAPVPAIHPVDHHLAHAASAFLFSPFSEAGVLVIDGAGENCSTTWYDGTGNAITQLGQEHQNASLGIMYDAVSEYLGFAWTEAGKTMGLSPFGEPHYEFERVRVSSRGYEVAIDRELPFDAVGDIWKADFARWGIEPVYSPRRINPYTFSVMVEADFAREHEDLAASAQRTLEDCYVSLAELVVRLTGRRQLCVAGGVALNCVANGRLERSGVVDDLFVIPVAGDAGAALGAAAWVCARAGNPVRPLQHPYLGPSFSSDEIERYLRHIGASYCSPKDLVATIADDLAGGATVGWFRGRGEVGPRALGHRSILAHPGLPGIRDKLNRRVKLRENFRPYGPSILEGAASDWLVDARDAPFMLTTFPVRQERQALVDAITHVDGSTRPQTVHSELTPAYDALIKAFSARTDVPMLLNTSFNLRGEPMVGTPFDAVRTFAASSLDVLVLEDFVLRKRVQ
jgi:carbamoyltransferase